MVVSKRTQVRHNKLRHNKIRHKPANLYKTDDIMAIMVMAMAVVEGITMVEDMVVDIIEIELMMVL